MPGQYQSVPTGPTQATYDQMKSFALSHAITPTNAPNQMLQSISQPAIDETKPADKNMVMNIINLNGRNLISEYNSQFRDAYLAKKNLGCADHQDQLKDSLTIE